jgi:hypothetical protein
MSNLVPVSRPSNELARPDLDRTTARELQRIQSGGIVLAARHMATVNAIADVTETALVAAAHVSATEAMLSNQYPYAELRLQHIADAGCASLAGVVLAMGRRSQQCS